MITQATTRRRTKSAQIADQLRLQLSKGHYALGQRFYSNNTLAEEFGVSAPTASNIIDELCRDGLVERRNGSGTYVTGKALTQSVVTYGILSWLDLHDPHTYGNLGYEMVVSFERECAIQGKKAQLINLYDDYYQNQLQTLIEGGLHGVFILPSYDQERLDHAVAMVRKNAIPAAHWESTPPRYPDSIGVCYDDAECGRTATDHLLTLGHKRIAAVGRVKDGLWGQRRMEGYRDAMCKARIPAKQQSVNQIPENGLKPSYLISLLRQLQEQGFTAIMASNDALAQELILAGRATGIRVPEDFSITGVDNSKEAILMGLTTIDRPALTVSQAILNVLENLRLNPEDVTAPPALQCPLIVRQTTTTPPVIPAEEGI